MKSTLCLLLLAASCAASGQSLLAPYATRNLLLSSLAPAFGSAAVQEHNPAALGSLTRFSAVLWGERRYLLKELSAYRLHAALPLSSGTFALGVARAGSPNWQETGVQGSYAHRLGTRAAAGIGAQWIQVGNDVYGRGSALIATAGFRWAFTESVHAGFTISNPARVRLEKESDDRLPATYSLGLGWQHDAQWMLAAALLHHDGHPPALLGGAEYVFAKALRARCGVDSGGPAAWLGVGTCAAKMRIDVTVTLHRGLGTTPVLLLVYPAQ